jgi:hypothetical protein
VKRALAIAVVVLVTAGGIALHLVAGAAADEADDLAVERAALADEADDLTARRDELAGELSAGRPVVSELAHDLRRLAAVADDVEDTRIVLLARTNRVIDRLNDGDLAGALALLDRQAEPLVDEIRAEIRDELRRQRGLPAAARAFREALG